MRIELKRASDLNSTNLMNLEETNKRHERVYEKLK